MVALAIVAITLVPVLARMTAAHARGRHGTGENRSRLLKAEGQRTRSGPGFLEERDRFERRREEIAAIRAARHTAVRRRRLAVLTLFVLCLVLLVLSFVLRTPWWFCLLPLIAVAAILAEGAVSAAKARRFERSVRDAERSARRRRTAARAASSVTGPVVLPPVAARAEGPLSRPVRSVRQVAHAVPLAGEERRRVLADVTPSVPIPARNGVPVSDGDAAPAATGVPATGHQRVPVPANRTDSLSSDLSSILSRRNSGDSLNSGDSRNSRDSLNSGESRNS